MTNLGAAPVEVPAGYEVVVASGPVTDGVPTDTTVWALPESV